MGNTIWWYRKGNAGNRYTEAHTQQLTVHCLSVLKDQRPSSKSMSHGGTSLDNSLPRGL